MESFSKSVKGQLSSVEIKKKCCKFTAAAMQELKKCGDGENSHIINEIFAKCRCDACQAVFVRELFILFGSVTDPQKQYHLDFSFKTELERDAVCDILSSLGFDFRKAVRRGRFVLYLKGSSDIEDFLVFVGAQNAAFDVMNSKIVHEFRNSVNRQVNCDTANIEKQLASVKKYTEAIKSLNESGKIEALPKELRETAQLRIENEQLSLADIGKLLNPPVTKSGVRHRLEKILDFAQSIEQGGENVIRSSASSQ